MLPKIAHSFAVADQGLESFVPLLPNLILHGSKTPSYLVGGDLGVPEAFPTLHRLHLEVVNADARDGRSSPVQYLIVHVRLFANLGAPQYHVVVGQWIGSVNMR